MRTIRPNILLFLTDDHAQWASHCYGNRELLTPNLDYLARTGARMANAFTPSPVCSPARASLLTGRVPSQHGIHDWLDERRAALDHPGLRTQPTLATLLHASGYRTGLVGKWHCGRSWEPQPGFDRWFSHWVAQYPHRGQVEFSDDGRHVEATGYQAAMVTDEAVRFVRDGRDDRPFFLVAGYVCTHTPHRDQPERWASYYRGCDFSDIPTEEFAACHGRAYIEWSRGATLRREELAQYYAAVSHVDEQVGRVLDAVEGAGALERTMVVYVSDHGHMNGHHGLHSKGEATIPQNFLEESIRVPLLLAWSAGGICAGQARREFVDHCDLYRTIADAAGVEAPAPTQLPGKSYLPLLRSNDVPDGWPDAQFCEYGNARMVRTGRFKLIRRNDGPNGRFPDELYDLLEDPRETENRMGAGAYASEVDDLSRRLAAHFGQYEERARSGWEIAAQPTCNGEQPWCIA